MYERLKSSLLWLLKVPPEPLDPMGDVRSLRVFRAARGYLLYISLGWVLSQLALLSGGVIALGAALAAAPDSGVAPVLVVVLGWLALVLFVAQAALTWFSLRLNYEMRWYKVTDRSLRIRSGVWSVHEMTMTFANVQNISIAQGPLERLFGISDVRVETAGGGGGGPHGKHEGLGTNLHVAVFRGVDRPEEIRDLILERLRRLRDAGLGDMDDGVPARGAHLPGAGPASDAEMMTLLTAFRDEARALRLVAERQ
jgi:membrane protein YdbS with pleckstrin-like domain